MNVRPATPEGSMCFFGYYDKCPWDEEEKYFLYHEVEFQDRPPTADDKARIMVISLASGETEVVGETYAWNFQQGAMLQWLPGRRILYNDRLEGRFVTRVRDLITGQERIFRRPVSAVSPDGKHAVGLNFSRLAVWRPGYGYEGIPDPSWNRNWPEDDGIWLLDLETGKDSLIIPLAGMLDFRKDPGIGEMCGRFNHTLFSPDGRRFIVLCRWKKSSTEVSAGQTRLFTSSLDGKELYDLMDTYNISHFDWKNNREIIAYAQRESRCAFWLVEDKTGRCRPVSEKMQATDGHCSYNSAETLILNDTYPIEEHRHLSIFDTRTEETFQLGRYLSPKIIPEIRCDLHPRWSRSETMISFDSLHEGYRRVYILPAPAGNCR